jgi:hypothetical protein
MTEVGQAVAALCPEIESELKPRLRGLTGLIISRYLPQTWVFATEREVASIVVDYQGNAVAYDGGLPNPDVSIRTDHLRLMVALNTRDARQVPPGAPPEVNYSTKKGRDAFQFLRGRFGL